MDLQYRRAYLERSLNRYTCNLWKLKKQESYYSPIDVPLYLTNAIEVLNEKIKKCRTEIQAIDHYTGLLERVKVMVVIPENFPGEYQRDLVGELSKFGIPSDQIEFLNRTSGSVLIILKMPFEAAIKLISLHASGKLKTQAPEIRRIEIIGITNENFERKLSILELLFKSRTLGLKDLRSQVKAGDKQFVAALNELVNAGMIYIEGTDATITDRGINLLRDQRALDLQFTYPYFAMTVLQHALETAERVLLVPATSFGERARSGRDMISTWL